MEDTCGALGRDAELAEPVFQDEDERELFGKQCAALWVQNTAFGVTIRELTYQRKKGSRYYLVAVKVDFDDAYELEEFVNAPRVNEPTTCTTSRTPANDLKRLQDLQNSDAAYEEKRAKARRQARIAAPASEVAGRAIEPEPAPKRQRVQRSRSGMFRNQKCRLSKLRLTTFL